MSNLLRIHPSLDLSLNCPKDDTKLEIKNVLIPGMRCLADTVCPQCKARYYVDLPTGHALWSAIALNQDTAECYDPRSSGWFGELLRKSFLNPVEDEITPTVHKFFGAKRIVIVNCLDFLYGHCLLKLLNVQRHLDQSPELGCCVLVPSQLVHLVPDGISEIWEIPLPIKDGWKWYFSLQKWIEQQAAQRDDIFLSPVYSHPSNRTYDLRRFVRNLPDISSEICGDSPILLFSYREDRLWGKNVADQQRNIQLLYNTLVETFPSLIFVLVGFGKQNQIHYTKGKIIDLRSNSFSVDLDRLWLRYMSAADCAIGVHGSNMLLPSGLSKATIELMPYSRLGNLFQDILMPQELQDIRIAFLKYRFLYGNESLTDVTVNDVTTVVKSVLLQNSRSEFWFSMGEPQ
ncbi:MAG: hypothetical protein HC878_20170 [Leptolyngbyaceae cyanobacterium SL_5_14]|nr:hypothetical protein [Leptolyngbyaceae cyanobacterium SL_5_14]